MSQKGSFRIEIYKNEEDSYEWRLTSNICVFGLCASLEEAKMQARNRCNVLRSWLNKIQRVLGNNEKF